MISPPSSCLSSCLDFPEWQTVICKPNKSFLSSSYIWLWCLLQQQNEIRTHSNLCCMRHWKLLILLANRQVPLPVLLKLPLIVDSAHWNFYLSQITNWHFLRSLKCLSIPLLKNFLCEVYNGGLDHSFIRERSPLRLVFLKIFKCKQWIHQLNINY